MEIISIIFSGLSLIIDTVIMVKMIKIDKNLKDLEDCYIDVNMDTLMRDSDDTK